MFFKKKKKLEEKNRKKFNVGDYVIANEKANTKYSLTQSGTVGQIVEVLDDGDIKIRTYDLYGKVYNFEVDSDCFYKITADDLYKRGIKRPLMRNFFIDITHWFDTHKDIFTSVLDRPKTTTPDEITPNKFKVEKIIFNDPATIVYANGKKFITKAAKDEPFDKEKGLAIALLKAAGISYSDIKEILEEAEDQNKKK